MRIVTKVEQIQGGRGRAKVYLDEAFAFVLYKKECRDLQITQGAEIPEETYREIMEEILPKRAKLRAMHLLEKRPYTEKGLRDKLGDGDYPAGVIDEAVRYVASYGYIDDAQYASDYAQTYLTRKSRARILTDLRAKGVDKETAVQAVDAVFAEQGEDAEALQITDLLRKKRYDPATDNTVYHQKIYAFLSRKGYSHEQIRHAMRSFDASAVDK